ncbi:hypothetical protein ACHAWF_017315 [Thalassiosira exigua]
MMAKIATKVAFAALAFAGLPRIDCLAFQLQHPRARKRVPTKRARNIINSSPYRSDAPQRGDDADGIASSVEDVSSPLVSRRSTLRAGAAAAALSLMAAAPRPSSATVVGGARTSARVETWPGIESLEPLYEFKLSLDAVAAGVKDPNNWPYVRKRLESFFGGFIVNEKNYFMGVGLQYMNEIKYDEGELPNYVLLDKESRFDALDGTMKNLEGLKKALAEDPSVSANVNLVEDLARSAQDSLRSFFSLIPEDDVKAVEELFTNVKKADVNGDGRLGDDEIIYLSPAEQEAWRRRVEKFG